MAKLSLQTFEAQNDGPVTVVLDNVTYFFPYNSHDWTVVDCGGRRFVIKIAYADFLVLMESL